MPKNDPALELNFSSTIKLALIFLVVVLGIVVGVYFSRDALLGLITGNVVAVVNYYLLIRIVGKITGVRPDGPPIWIFFILKFIFFLGMTGIALMVFKMDPFTFLAGFMTVILAAVVQGMKK